MADIIQLKLLENKSIVAEVNGRNYAYEGGYNIVAGDDNATKFEITSVPAKYSNFKLTVSMTNSRGQQVEPPEIIDNKFKLPVGMAVVGYGQIILSAHGVDENGDNVTAYFLPLKIKVANTKANWTSGVINGTIAINKVETLLPNEKAYAVNVGTSTDALINLGLPQGEPGKDGEDASPLKIFGETYYDPSLSYTWSTAELIPLPDFNATEEGTAYLVDDNEIKGQYDLYIHNHEATEWVVINNWGGIPGPKGDTGDKGNKGDKGDQGIQGEKGDTGNGIASTIIHYATSTSGTTAPTTGWQSTIPTVEKGSYLWTRTVITYANGDTSTSFSVAYQGLDGVGAVTSVNAKTGDVSLSYADIPPLVGMHHIQFSGEPTPAEIWSGTGWEIDTNYQGKTIIGSGGTYTLGASGGSATVTLTTAQLASHNHTQAAHYHGLLSPTTDTNLWSGNAIGGGRSTPDAAYYPAFVDNGTDKGKKYLNKSASSPTGYNWVESVTPTINSTGSGQAHENMPPYRVVNIWIRRA